MKKKLVLILLAAFASMTMSAQVYSQALLSKAQAGNKQAQCDLAFCYYNGKSVVKDLKKAYDWYLKAANSGYAAAQLKVGSFYEDGILFEENPEMAFSWYLKAAKTGYAEGEFMVGNCYAEGYGVEEDMKQARLWYDKAIKQGHSGAMNTLGVYYLDKKKDKAKAIYWFKQALKADPNNVAAKINLEGLE